MESEAVADILQRVADQQVTALRQLGQAGGEVAALLLLQGFQVLWSALPALVDHELGQRTKVSNNLVAVLLEVGGDLLELGVPLLLRAEEHLEGTLLHIHALE